MADVPQICGVCTVTEDTKTKGPASYFPSIEKKYGQPINHWLDLLKTASDKKHMEMVAALKNTELFQWETGIRKSPSSLIKNTYLIGYPKKKQING